MTSRTFATSVIALALISGVAAVSRAGVLLTDIQMSSDGGGVWNNDNTNNWAIWMAAQTTPAATSAFLNSHGGSGHLPNTPVYIPVGTTSYVLYKGDYGSSDQTDNFIFGSHVLTINPNLAYIASSSTAATGTAGPISFGNETVSISGFGWYAPGAFGVQNVGTGQSINTSTANDVAVITFTVTAPEPASGVLFGLGAVGTFIAVRRRRKV